MYGSRYVYIYLYIFMVCKGVPAPPPFLRHPPLDPACPTLFKIFTLLPFKNRGGGSELCNIKMETHHFLSTKDHTFTIYSSFLCSRGEQHEKR